MSDISSFEPLTLTVDGAPRPVLITAGPAAGRVVPITGFQQIEPDVMAAAAGPFDLTPEWEFVRIEAPTPEGVTLRDVAVIPPAAQPSGAHPNS